MKVIHLPAVPKKSKVRTRRSDVGGTLASFYPGDRLTSVIEALRERCRQLKIKPPSRSLVYREGGFMFCRKLNADLKKAQKGELHAKKREVKFGLSH
jgi:hypothetical protein